MRRSTLNHLVLTSMLAVMVAVTFVIAGVGFSSSTPSSEQQPELSPEHSPEPATGPTLLTQSPHADFNQSSVVKPVHHGPNHPPAMNTPFDDRSRVVLFPKGPGAVLEFEGEPATDDDEDVLTYRFGIAIPGKPGIRSPREALLLVTRVGNRFMFRPYGSVSPERFASVYGNVGTVPILPAVVFASDGRSESRPEFFNLTLVYDVSTRNLIPSEPSGEYPEEAHEPYGRSEEASDSVERTKTDLNKVVGASRVLRLDPPIYAAETVGTIMTTR